ncbi:MAG: hypothetical protein II462_04655 [Muribaculaceae bacterium]|nr:hypothetical protein [Muribaculaceae bacterium]
MKKTLLIALMAIVATTTVTAQDIEQRGDRRGHDPEKRVEGQVKRLDKKLKLSQEQQQQVKDIYQEFDKAQQARMEQMRIMQQRESEAMDAKIKALLTDEQKAKYDEMRAKDREKGKGDGEGFQRGRGHGSRHGGYGGHRGGPNRMGHNSHNNMNTGGDMTE